jgi:hypothetical protein
LTHEDPLDPRLAYAACLFTLAYVPIHVVWALGGTLLLPGGDATASLPGLRAANWIVSAFLVVGAIVVLALVRHWGRRIPRALLLVPIYVAAIVCLSHALFGFITKGLYLAGVQGAVSSPMASSWTAAERARAIWLDLAVFEPWFLLEGVLLTAVGRQAIVRLAGRRWWIVGVVVGALLLLVFGGVLAFKGLTFAIG